jgi:hypothetical protein
MSIAALVLTTVVIGFIALIRGRVALAVVVTLFIVGANATVQAAKYAIQRPDFGVDPERAAAGNSFPSGHTAVAVSFAVALVLVLPPRLRGVAAVLGAGYAALAGVATLSAGWHRPSDAVAAILVVGAWAAAAGLLLVLVQRRGAQAERHGAQAGVADAHPVAAKALALGGLGLLAVAAVSFALTHQVLAIPPDELSQRRLLAAYAGSAAGIAGAAALTMALVLSTVHRVVPGRV